VLNYMGTIKKPENGQQSFKRLLNKPVLI